MKKNNFLSHAAIFSKGLIIQSPILMSKFYTELAIILIFFPVLLINLVDKQCLVDYMSNTRKRLSNASSGSISLKNIYF